MTLAAAAHLLQCPSKKQPPHVAYGKHCLVLVLTWQIIGNVYAETESAVAILCVPPVTTV